MPGNLGLIPPILNGFLNFLFPENLSCSTICKVVQSSNSFIAEEVYNKLRNQNHKIHLAKTVDNGHINISRQNFQIFQGIKQANSFEKNERKSNYRGTANYLDYIVNFLILELKLSNLVRKRSV